MIIVLLKDNATPVTIDDVTSKPKPLIIKNPTTVVRITCKTPTSTEAFPVSLTVSGLKLIPTINKSIAIPIFANNSTCTLA